MFEREFIERRESERRANANAAIARHYAQCERRKRERRAIDNAICAYWEKRFHATKSQKVKVSP